MPPIANIAVAVQLILAAVGLVLFWREVVSPAARRRASASAALPPWNGEPLEFALLLVLVFAGTFIFGLVVASLLKLHPLTGDAATIASGAAAQLGMLAGVSLFAAKSAGYRTQGAASIATVLKSGAATFVISLPLLYASSNGWELLLQLFGIPAERQDLIRMFAQAKTPWLIVVLVILATVIAPVTEEMVFRAGLYRFARTRAPRFLALVIPALIFAALHVNWSTLEGFASFVPLLVLAILFSIAYERTGHVGTTIVAHALFNLNTILLIFCGVST